MTTAEEKNLLTKRPRSKTRIAAIVFIAVVLGAALWFLRPPAEASRVKVLNVNSSFSYRFAALTHGTNHVLFRGNVMLAKLRWKLSQSLPRYYSYFPRHLRAERYAARSETNTTVLWLGWSPGNSRGRQPLCQLTDSAGATVTLPFLTAPQVTSGSHPFVFVQPFELPPNLANLAGCKVRIYWMDQPLDHEVATLQLQ